VADLVDTDVVALARRFLAAHTRLTEELGGEGRVASLNEPPYPRIRLSDPPGNDRTLTHLIAPLLQVEVLGDIGVTGQKPMLRRVLYVALQALRDLPEAQALGDWARIEGEPVVTYVESTGGGGFVPEPTGQPRYLATVRLYVHP
jgi:hypothetical protein